MGLQMSRRRNGIAYPFDSVPQTLLSTVQSLLDQTEFQLVKMDLACSSECSQRSVRSEEEQTPVDLQQLDSDSLRPVSSPQSLVVVPHHPSPSSTKKERCFRSERSMKKTNQSRSIENVQNTLTTDQSLTQTQPVLVIERDNQIPTNRPNFIGNLEHQENSDAVKQNVFILKRLAVAASSSSSVPQEPSRQSLQSPPPSTISASKHTAMVLPPVLERKSQPPPSRLSASALSSSYMKFDSFGSEQDFTAYKDVELRSIIEIRSNRMKL
ncbi:hypothetical protein NH340_JMT07167 [Sarcoptes scabiei]|nr:hypothetical protein NH340_JMT07167 [Sarcoptes scabiei]